MPTTTDIITASTIQADKKTNDKTDTQNVSSQIRTQGLLVTPIWKIVGGELKAH